MGQRSELHDVLVDIVGDSDRVYFQPPSNVKMQYPCIVYRRDFAETQFADNNPYNFRLRYAVTVMDRNPDSVIPKMVAALPMCIFDRYYPADQINHDVFKLFF